MAADEEELSINEQAISASEDEVRKISSQSCICTSGSPCLLDDIMEKKCFACTSS